MKNYFDSLNVILSVMFLSIFCVFQDPSSDLKSWLEMMENNLILLAALPLFVLGYFSYLNSESISSNRNIKIRRHLQFSLVLGLYFSTVFSLNLNLVKEFEIYSNSPGLFLKESQKVWLDSRFHELDGKYRLKKNDLISFEQDGYFISGQIKALPGDQAFVNILDHQSRAVVNAIEIPVPEKYVAIAAGQNGDKVSLIAVNKIKGKVHLNYSDFFREL
jgi:hypothetical protein